MNWLGLDIGGANIKAALSDGSVSSIPFRFWVEHERLKDSLSEIITELSSSEPVRIAATMTAELADCFETRQVGVEFIVDCLDSVCSQLGLSEPVYAGTDLAFRTGDDAKDHWLKTAASNWTMMAAFASRFLPQQSGLVIDMGSTTTDIIPVTEGNVAAIGKTDSQRLQHGELVYVGAKRTPVCSIVQSLESDGAAIPIAREFFATVDDAMLLCEFAAENDADCDTADGRPRTIACAAQRLCRMICEDTVTMRQEDVTSLASQVLKQVERLLLSKIDEPSDIICTGSGVEFLMHVIKKRFPSANVTTLGSFAGAKIDAAAPAFATAVLASERPEL